MRTLSADWMANTNKPEAETQSLQHGDESKGNFFYPRPVAPTTAQVLLYQVSFTSSLFLKVAIVIQPKIAKSLVN